MKPRLWTLSYDIGEPRRLQRVARVALAHGDRVQKSLYLCALDHDAVGALQHRLAGMLDAEADRALLRPICRACRRATRTQGEGGAPERQEPFWIV
jgi:CRISPR-associated protein Cas2